MTTARPTRDVAECGEARICMPTFSAARRHIFRACFHEAQDVLCSGGDVDLIHVEPADGVGAAPRRTWRRWAQGLAERGRPGRREQRHAVVHPPAWLPHPGLRSTPLTKTYEVFVMVCPLWSDVWDVEAIEGWQDNCRTSVCWIDELWAADVPRLAHEPWAENWLSLLARFDHVIVGCPGTGEALAQALGRTCHEVASGVDALRFSPLPNPPARVVDVLSIGRRQQGVHRALLELASSGDLFYVHDTLLDGGGTLTRDHVEHREMYARMAKRSRFFTASPGLVDIPERTRGQVVVGARFYEGTAAGSVLLGQAPDCERFRRHFDWQDALVEIAPDGSDVGDVIRELRSRPERLREIGRRNVAESLRRHDWAYRWSEILDIAGLEPAPMLDERVRQLASLADEASSS